MGDWSRPQGKKVMDKVDSQAPNTFKDWINLDKVIIPCLKGKPLLKSWSGANFKISEQEWAQKYSHCEIALRLDDDVDFDIDNDLVKRFIGKYIVSCGAISGRPTNPTSHYWWRGKLDFKQFALPKELEDHYKDFPHGGTLCEIRNGPTCYTIVPKSKHSKANEYVTWEKFTGMNQYPGDLNKDLRKVALSAALSILYGGQGKRDQYCTAIAGVLSTHTDWSEKDISEFIYNIAVESNDEEAEKRKSKGTSIKKARRKLGIPTLAEIVGCSQKTIAELFRWVGVNHETTEGAAAVTEIIEYGSDRYFVKVKTKVNGILQEKEVQIDGPTLMNQKAFYDAVISKAQVWLPKMKPVEFEKTMKRKFEERKKSKLYVAEADESYRFKKLFRQYLSEETVYEDKKALASHGSPFQNIEKNYLEFSLNGFEDFLERKRAYKNRTDLVIDCQKILKARRINGKYDGRSCVSWRIDNFKYDERDIILEGEAEEVKEITHDS